MYKNTHTRIITSVGIFLQDLAEFNLLAGG